MPLNKILLNPTREHAKNFPRAPSKILALLHAVHVLLQADLLIARLGGVVAKQLRNLGAVGRVLVDAQLQALAELLIELPEIDFGGGGGGEGSKQIGCESSSLTFQINPLRSPSLLWAVPVSGLPLCAATARGWFSCYAHGW